LKLPKNIWEFDSRRKFQLHRSDSNNNRVLHFPKNSTIADVVLGQTEFVSNTNAYSCNETGLYEPFGITIEPTNCSALWVADYHNARVLLYTLPVNDPAVNNTWYNGQPATAVLGQTNFTVCGPRLPATSSNFEYPIDVHYSALTGYLYVSANSFNRILASNTTFQGYIPPFCFGICEYQDIVVNDNETFSFNGTLLTVYGNVTFSPQSTIILTAGQTLSVQTGCVSFSGTLHLYVDQITTTPQTINPITYDCYSGKFDNIVVTTIDSSSNSKDNCGSSQSEHYGTNSLSVLFSLNSCPSASTYGSATSDNTKIIIIAVVVSVVGVMIIFFVVLIIVSIILWRLKKMGKFKARTKINF